jgi:hypothetical protein
VAVQDEIAGLGPRTERPRLNATVDLTHHSLSPTEGFVLSRVDGQLSYDEICMVSGLDREQTLQILRSLKQARIILSPGEVAIGSARKPTRSGHTPPELAAAPEPPPPARAVDTASASPPAVESHPASAPVSSSRTRPGPPASSTTTGQIAGPLERLDDGSPVDASDLTDWAEASLELKARIIRLHRRLKQISAFDLLGVSPDTDSATVRRAFAIASKELHPDRYFGKNLGRFKPKLAGIFARLSEAVQEIERTRKGKR